MDPAGKVLIYSISPYLAVMKKILVSLFVLPLLSFVLADWITVKLDDHVHIDFPSEPITTNYGGNPVWVKDIDSTSRCMALVVDMGKMGLDSTQMAAEFEKPETFTQFRESMMANMPGAVMISEKKTRANGNNTFEFLVNMEKVNEGAVTRMYSKNIFYGTKMYSLSFYEMKSGPQPELREKFFNSFRLH